MMTLAEFKARLRDPDDPNMLAEALAQLQSHGLGAEYLAEMAADKKAAPATFPPPVAAALRAAIGAWQSTQATKETAPTADDVLAEMAQDTASFTDYAARLGLPGDHQAIAQQLFNQPQQEASQ